MVTVIYTIEIHFYTILTFYTLSQYEINQKDNLQV